MELQPNSYILFTDNTMNSTVLYVSPSIRDNIGWEPEEVIGTSCLAFVTPEGTVLLKFSLIF